MCFGLFGVYYVLDCYLLVVGRCGFEVVLCCFVGV